MDNVQKALDRVMKARAELIMTRTFYGVLVGQVEPVASSDFPTMATNGKQHFFNPDFILSLSPAEVLGTQVHESEHDARRHHTRRGWREPVEWNVCTDLEINPDVIAQGFKLPKGFLFDEKYRGMSAEDIYRTREIERAEEERKRQDEEETPEADEDEGEDGLDDADTDPGHSEPEQGEDEAEGGDQGEPEDDTSEGEPQDGGEGDGEGESPGDADEGAQGDAEGEGEADGEADGEGTGESSGADADGEAEGTGQPRSSGDPGGCGEVLDAAPDAAGMADEDAKWERVVRQAARLAAKRGDAPGHVAREIERSDHPPQDWRETLRAFFDGGATTTETWNRPNRRFVGDGLYLPGRQRDGVNKAVFMIDTSGSVTYYPGALEAIKVETQAALDEHIIDEVVVMYGDTRVTRIDTYASGDELEFDPRGGGGTVMKPLFDHVANEIDDASLIVAFTDLEIEPESMLGPEPHCPLLWAVVGYPENVKRYLTATPWGAPGIEVRPDK